MLKKLRTVLFLFILAFFMLPLSACASNYDSIKISLSTSISAIENNRVELIRELKTSDSTNQFSITANVSAKKGVPTDLEVNIDKPDLVKILNIETRGSSTIVNCEGVGAGEAQIKFVSFGGKTATLNIFVNEPLRDVSVDPSYQPFAFVGKTIEFDKTKILYNSFSQGAVEPNLENKQVRFYANMRGVSVNEITGAISIDSTYDAARYPSFQLRIEPLDENINYVPVTIKVLKPQDAQRNNISIESTSNVEPKSQVVIASDKVLDVDLGLFPTDVDYKSAIVNVQNFLISDRNDIPETVYSFEEVGAYNSTTNFRSGYIDIKTSEFNKSQILLSAKEVNNQTAYVNVYASLKGFEETTKVLIARIKIKINFMPNNIVVRDLNNNVVTDTINVYNKLALAEFQKLNIEVFEGRQHSDLSDGQTSVYVILNSELVDVVGAEKLSGGRYKITNFEEFGLRLNDLATLESIANEQNVTVSFYASKKFKINDGAREEEIIFNRTTQTFKLNMLLFVDGVKFWNEQNTEPSDIIELNIVANSSSNEYVNQVKINFSAYLNGVATNDFSKEAIDFTFERAGDTERLRFDYKFDQVTPSGEKENIITLYPTLNSVGKYVLRVNGFGIDSNKNKIVINCYEKPNLVKFHIGNSGTSDVTTYNLPVNSTAVGYFEAYSVVDHQETVQTFAELNIKDIEIVSENGKVVPNSFYKKDGRLITFNSRNIPSGNYMFNVKVTDGGNNVYTKTFNVLVYIPVYPTSFNIKAGDNRILSNLADILYTKSSIAFDKENSESRRDYALYIPSIGDNVDALGANGITYRFSYLDQNGNNLNYNNNLFIATTNSNGTITNIATKDVEGTFILRATIFQHNQLIAELDTLITIKNATMVGDLAEYSDLAYIGVNEGYGLYRTNLDGKINNFDINLPNSLTLGAMDARIGYMLDENAKQFVEVSENGQVKFKVDNETDKNIIGDGYLYVYAKDSLDSEFNINALNGNYIKIHIIVADGVNIPVVITTQSELFNLSKQSLKYQLRSNIMLTGAFDQIADFSGSLDGNNFIIYNVDYNNANGLFNTISGTIKNLNISYVNLPVSLTNFGFIASNATSSAVFENVNVSKNSTESTTGLKLVGVNSGRIVNCYINNVAVSGDVSLKKDVSGVQLIKNQIDFSVNEKIDLNTLFNFTYSSEAGDNPNVDYVVTNDAVVVNNFVAVTRVGNADITVKYGSNSQTFNVTFNYKGVIPEARQQYLFEVRKNNPVDLKKLKDTSETSTLLVVERAEILSLDGQSYEVVEDKVELDKLVSIDASGKFIANRSGTYVIAEIVEKQGFGIILTNKLTVKVFEGATNLSANIINGENISETSAKVAPFETLQIQVKVTTDVTYEEVPNIHINPLYGLDNFNPDWFNIGYLENYQSGYKLFTFYIGVKEDYQNYVLNNIFEFKFETINKKASSTIRVEYVTTLPNYIETYFVDSTKENLSNVTLNDNINEIIPEFRIGESSVGGYQTFVFDVFPDYLVGESELRIEATKVVNRSDVSGNKPLPFVLTSTGLVNFGEGVNAEINSSFASGDKNYYILPIYMPLSSEVNSAGESFSAEIGDVYEFMFTVYVNNQKYVIYKNLEVTYPILLSGNFDSLTQQKTMDGAIDAVAFGTTFDVTLTADDPSIDMGDNIVLEYVTSNNSKISRVEEITENKANNIFKYRVTLNNYYSLINPDFSQVSLTFTARKTLNGKVALSNRVIFNIIPVIYKIESLDISHIVDNEEVNLFDNEKLSISSKHKFRVVPNVTYDKRSQTILSKIGDEETGLIANLKKSLNGLGAATDGLNRLPYLSYQVGENLPVSLAFPSNDISKRLTFTGEDNDGNISGISSNGIIEVETDSKNSDGNEISIMFGAPQNLNLVTNARFKIVQGVYELDFSNTTGTFFRYSTTKPVEIFASTNDDMPTPIYSFKELKQYATTDNNANADNVNASIMLMQDIDVYARDLSDVVGTNFKANFASLDGNGYTITIHQNALDYLVNNFVVGESAEQATIINVGLFTEISENTIIKNLNIAIAGEGNTSNFRFSPISNVSNANIQFNFGLLAGVNNGVVTNCQIVSNEYNKQVSVYPFPYAANSSETSVNTINANIGGLVGVNTGYITNSSVNTTLYVGGNFQENYNRYTSNGNFVVGGFVAENSGKIASSKFVDASIFNNARSYENILTAGFTAVNSGSIMYSYAEGDVKAVSDSDGAAEGPRGRATINTTTIAAGFVYRNTGFISDSLSNLTLNGGGGVAGFVQENGLKEQSEEQTVIATIENCISLSDIVNYKNRAMRPFTGITLNTGDTEATDTLNNFGQILNSYYLEFNNYVESLTLEEVPKLNSTDISNAVKFTGYAFNSLSDNDNSAVWKIDGVGNNIARPVLVSANFKINPHRKLSFTSVDENTGNPYYHYHYDEEYGSENNPVIVYDVDSFNKIADYGNNNKSYRIIKDITFDSFENRILTTNTTFYGRLDGNGMLLSSLYINLENQTKESVGIFANLVSQEYVKNDNSTYLKTAEVKSLNIDVRELYASQVSTAGVIAGIVSDANVYNIKITSQNGAVVHGKNIVGGAVGLVLGQSQLFNIDSSVDVLSTYAGSNLNLNEIGKIGATSSLLNLAELDSFSGLKNSSDKSYDIDKEKDALNIISNHIKEHSFAGGIVGAYSGVSVDGFTPMLSRLYSENSRVEGGIAGGVIGGVEASTVRNGLGNTGVGGVAGLVIDLKYTTDLTRGRVIGRIASGGVVGENHGTVMFARSEHTSEVQAEIDNVDALTNLYNETLYNNSIFGTQTTFAVGGLVGLNINGSIQQSYSRVAISNYKTQYAGGIVGIMNGGSISTVYTTSSVVASSAVGGIIGEMVSTNDPEDDTQAETTGDVTLTNVYALNAYTERHNIILNSITRKSSLFGFIDKTAGKLTVSSSDVGVSEEFKLNNNNVVFENLFVVAENGEVKQGSTLNTHNIHENYNANFVTGTDGVTKISSDADSNKEFTLQNTILSFDAELHGNIRRKIFSPFYYDINEVWQKYEQALASKNPLPVIVNFKNYLGTTTIIDNKNEFIEFINNCNSSNNNIFLNSTVNINCNIDLNISDFNGLQSPLIKGTFKGRLIGVGNDKKTINLNGLTLFNELANAHIENINFTSEELTTNTSEFGLVALKANNSRFENCDVKIVNILANNIKNVGGFIASGSGVVFVDCSVEIVEATVNTTNFGGFVGLSASDQKNDLTGNILITNSTCKVQGNFNAQNVGGFVGKAQVVDVNGAEVKISASTNKQNANIGGVVAYANGNSTISNVNVDAISDTDTSTTKQPSYILVNGSNSNSVIYAGFVGGYTPATIYTNCQVDSSTINVNTTSGYVGSIAGSAQIIDNSYSLASINGERDTANLKIGGLSGYLGVLANESFFAGTINAPYANVAGFVSDNLGVISKCYVADRVINGSNASGFVLNNSGRIENCYSTAKLTANASSGVASGIVINNYISENNLIKSGTIKNSYFAGRNIAGKTVNPIYNENSGNIENVIYCKNFGFNNREDNSGKTIEEMITGEDLIGENFVRQIDSFNLPCFPLLNCSVSNSIVEQFNNYQLTNKNLIPEFLTQPTQKITNSDGFYCLSLQAGSIVSDPLMADGTFTGILYANPDNEITTTSALFNKIEGATIFGVNFSSESIINANGAIANEARTSNIEKCSFNGELSNVNSAGGFVNTAYNCVFNYCYIGEKAQINAKTAGGFIHTSNYSTFNSCYFAGTINASEGATGFALNGTGLNINNCYSSGNLLYNSYDGRDTLNTFNLNVNSFSKVSSGVSITNSYSIAYIYNIKENSYYYNATGKRSDSSTIVGYFKFDYLLNNNSTIWVKKNQSDYFPQLNGVGGQYTDREDGRGTRVNPVQINSLQELQNIKNNPSYAYILSNDIVDSVNFKKANQTNGENVDFTHFEPIDNFSGTLFGNNNTINNLFITNKTYGVKQTNDRPLRDNSPLGLFGKTQNPYVFDLTLSNCELYSSNVIGGAGFIVGQVETGKAYLSNINIDETNRLFAGFIPEENTSYKNKTHKYVGDGSVVGVNNSIDYTNSFYENANVSTDGKTYTSSIKIWDNMLQLGSDGKYHITNANDFVQWALTRSSTSMVLENDIDLSEYIFGAEGNVSAVLTQLNSNVTIDGNFHTISNLYCSSFIGTNYGTIKNLNIYNAYVTGTTNLQTTGLIVDLNESSGKIINCVASGAISNYRLGGAIVGQNLGTVTNSFGSAYNGTTSIVNDIGF